MRNAHTPARHESPRGEINITPLVDVVLVLLIISMVVVPMIAVHPPETPSPEQLPRKEDLVTVSVKDDGSVWYDSQALDRAVLVDRLAEIHRQNERKQILLVADATLRFHDVKALMGVARAAGFPGINLAARREAPR